MCDEGDESVLGEAVYPAFAHQLLHDGVNPREASVALHQTSGDGEQR